MRLLTISAAVLALLSVAFLPFEASAIKLKSLTMHDAKGLKRRPLHLSQVFQEGEDHFRSEWERAISEFDKDGDGKISLDEILQAYSGYIGVRVEDLPEDIRRYIEDDFHRIDANGDGTVDFEEALQAFGPHDNQLVQMFVASSAPPARPENGTQPPKNNTQPPKPENGTQPPKNSSQPPKPENGTQPPKNNSHPPKPENDTKPPKPQNGTQPPKNNTQPPKNDTQQPPKPDNNTKPPKNDSKDAQLKKEWEQALDLIDTDHDGKLSRKEVYELYALSIGVKAKDLSKKDKREVDYIFDIIDASGDGYITFQEYKDLMATASA